MKPDNRRAEIHLPCPRGFPPLPQSRATIREWDRRAIGEFAIPGLTLMENAGRSAALWVAGLVESTECRLDEPVIVLCGPGNNGGDGLVVARHLHDHGLDVHVFLPEGVGYRPESDAGRNFAAVEARRTIPIRRLRVPGREDLSGGTLVDALFGTGLARELVPPYRDWIDAITDSGRPTVAIDTPSGLDADTGQTLGAAVRAAHTVTFAAAKLGFSLAQGPLCCGQVHVVDIGIPRELWASATA